MPVNREVSPSSSAAIIVGIILVVIDFVVTVGNVADEADFVAIADNDAVIIFQVLMANVGVGAFVVVAVVVVVVVATVARVYTVVVVVVAAAMHAVVVSVRVVVDSILIVFAVAVGIVVAVGSTAGHDSMQMKLVRSTVVVLIATTAAAASPT